jgi:hypothetical protein
MRKPILPVVVLSCAMAFSSVSMAGEPSDHPDHVNPLRLIVGGVGMLVVVPLMLLSWEMDQHRSPGVTTHAARAEPATPPVYSNNYIHGPGYVGSN